MKQTAVEWLADNIMPMIPFHTLEYRNNFIKFIEQSKAMEKQQHGKTWDTALDKYEVRAGNYMRAYEDFDDYYNENFKL